MKTWNAKPHEIEKKWWLIDAENQTVGRLATQIANTLRGKNKPVYTPHVDTGDFVVLINAKKMRFTGNKLDDKKYYSHSRFFGSLKETTARELFEKDSTKVITKAVEGMLPKNRLSRQILKKLKAYDGAEHPHQAQKLETLSLN